MRNSEGVLWALKGYPRKVPNGKFWGFFLGMFGGVLWGEGVVVLRYKGVFLEGKCGNENGKVKVSTNLI